LWMSWVLLLISAPPGAGNGRRKIVPERSKSLQEFLTKEAPAGPEYQESGAFKFPTRLCNVCCPFTTTRYALLLSAIFAGRDC
jgi:hypothetical protein